MPEYYGMTYLKDKLKARAVRVRTRYGWYEQKARVNDLGISTPPSLRLKQSVMGWCAKSVDALADRLQFRGFENDLLDMSAIYAANNADILMDSAILSALIASCCFIAISPDEEGYPRLQVVDGSCATGRIDPITNMLLEGYAVLETDKRGRPVTEAYFTAEETVYYRKGQEPEVWENPAGRALLVPIIHRPDAVRPFGHSRISRACMSISEAAARTVKRSEISAEFYSFPQRYIVGLSDDVEIRDKWTAAMSAMFTISKGDESEKPTIGQFQQATMSPHMEQLRMFAALFAGETGLTVDDLGFVSDNPSSAEAIKASHETLRLAARKAQRDFAVGFLNAGYLAACLRDQTPYERRVITRTKLLWEPIFEPDSAALSGIGDGIIKLNQAVPGYVGGEALRQLTGIEGGNGNG